MRRVSEVNSRLQTPVAKAYWSECAVARWWWYGGEEDGDVDGARLSVFWMVLEEEVVAVEELW